MAKHDPFLTPDENALMAQLDAAEASGEDLFAADDASIMTEDAAAELKPAPAPAPVDAAKAEEGEGDEEGEAEAPAPAPAEPEPAPAEAPAPAPVAAPVAASAPAEPAPTFSADDLGLPAMVLPPALPRTIDANATAALIGTLNNERDALQDKYDDGAITRDQYRAELRPLEAKLNSAQSALTEDRVIAKQTEASENGYLHALAERAKAIGLIDYSNAANGAAFDTALTMVKQNPAYATKGFIRQVAEAHRMVLALNGKLPAPRAAAPAPVAKAPVVAAAPAANRKPPAPPPNLGDIPAASIPHTGTDARGALASLNGKALTTQWEKLTQAQQNAMLGEG